MDDDIRILIDFGSTFTKVVAVNIDAQEIVSQARVPSTVETDITVGLKEALKGLSVDLNISDLDLRQALACSSAAGGLRMVCVGFVPELTSEAANRAALGAGAKVVGCFSYELEEREVEEIEALSPDIILLSGGTNGGNKKVITHNAEMLSRANGAVTNIIVAGNKAAYGDIKAIFASSDKRVIFTRNVMPEIGKLELAPCNQEIREMFMKNIIKAKGIAKAKAIIKDVIMPTPSAVLDAAKLIADGFADAPGLGELIVIDVGGATTDVHSIAKGNPSRADVITASLPEPYEKRTVEGDIGLKYNLDTLVGLIKERETPANFDAIVKRFHEGKLAETEEEIACHHLLSYLAVEVAMNRHAGRIEAVYGPAGQMLIQRGKDLTGVKCVIGTGGPLAFSRNSGGILGGVLFREETPAILKPKTPKFYIDENCILYAVGLLGQNEPAKALSLAKKHLKQV
jgi:uncharacterized protein (TIGR01319 family)